MHLLIYLSLSRSHSLSICLSLYVFTRVNVHAPLHARIAKNVQTEDLGKPRLRPLSSEKASIHPVLCKPAREACRCICWDVSLVMFSPIIYAIVYLRTLQRLQTRVA